MIPKKNTRLGSRRISSEIMYVLSIGQLTGGGGSWTFVIAGAVVLQAEMSKPESEKLEF